MATARYQLPLRVYEQPVRNPATLEDAEKNRHPVLLEGDVVISGRNPDEVRKKARAHLEADGRVIRSLAIGPKGVLAVVYTAGVKKDPRTMKERRRSY